MFEDDFWLEGKSRRRAFVCEYEIDRAEEIEIDVLRVDIEFGDLSI